MRTVDFGECEINMDNVFLFICKNHPKMCCVTRDPDISDMQVRPYWEEEDRFEGWSLEGVSMDWFYVLWNGKIQKLFGLRVESGLL